MSLLNVNSKLYAIAQFESTPAMMYMTQVTQGANGVLTPTPNTLVPVDFSAYGGLSRPCAGSTTPWQSHLGSEETIMVNARDFEANFYGTSTNVGGSNTYATVGFSATSLTGSGGQGLLDHMRYFGKYPATVTTNDIITNIDPYMYGYINEVKVVSGVPVATKHFSIGRAAWEMAYVMPDQQTVYGSVDDNNAAFYKFVANTPGDLSAGTLSCAVFTQTSPVGGAASSAAFNIGWISMGATSNSAALNYLNGAGTANGVNAQQLTFSDIFNIDLPTSSTSGACNTGFTSVNTAYSYKAGSTTYNNECLKRALPTYHLLIRLLRTLMQPPAPQ
jgi:secreted PhoX family phosphatase